MKKCSKCKLEKEKERFYRNLGQCKECKKEYKEKWNQENREHVRKVVHENYLRNKDKVIERTKRWRQENKEKFNKSWKKSHEKDKSKRRARKIVNYHLQKGNLAKPLCCETCLKQGQLEAHHEDYNLPLNVKWLCTSCHGIKHRLRKIG